MENVEVHQSEWDVIVVGGGVAGTFAAIEASKAGAKTVIVDKANIFRSGCASAGNDHFMAFLEAGEEWDTKKSFLDYYQRLTKKFVDINVAEKVFAENIIEVVKLLEQMGVQMKDPQTNRYIRTRSFGQPGDYYLNFQGRDIKPILTKEAIKKGAKLMPYIYTTNLLVNENKIFGAIGFNIHTGDIHVFRGKKVILATGNIGRLANNNTGNPYNCWHSPYNTGTAISLAFKVNATLSNMEFIHYTLVPRNFSAPGVNALVGMGCHLVNALGERYIFKYDERGEQGPRWVLPWSTYWEIKEGRGPCYFDLRHLSSENFDHLTKKLLPVDKNTFMDYVRQKGLDLKKDLLEVEISEGQLSATIGSISGILINEKCETTVENLYAAGGCATTVSNLSGSMCSGLMSGREAAKAAAAVRSGEQNDIELTYVDELKEKINKLKNGGGKISYLIFENKIRQIMSNYVGIGRTELGLDTAMKELNKWSSLENEIHTGTNHEIMKAFESSDLMITAQLMATAAKERKESRFGLNHFRGDFPDSDTNWNKITLLNNSKGEIKLSYKDIN
ncbi:MAG: FAD-dependent oxidoreductase [Peptococcaceae bacterium]